MMMKPQQTCTVTFTKYKYEQQYIIIIIIVKPWHSLMFFIVIYVIDENINITFWRAFIHTIMNCLFFFPLSIVMFFSHKRKKRFKINLYSICLHYFIHNNFHQSLIQIFEYRDNLSVEKVIKLNIKRKKWHSWLSFFISLRGITRWFSVTTKCCVQ